MGKSGKPKSFATVAAQGSKPKPQPPIVVPILGQLTSTLTCSQLDQLTKTEIINAIEIKFCTHICSCNVAKGTLITLYLRLLKDDPYKGQVIPGEQADTYIATRNAAA